MSTLSGMPSPVDQHAESMNLHNIYMNGFADDETGDVESPIGHLYRVTNRITCTNSNGYSETYVYATEADAIAVFAWANDKYSEWLDS